MGRARRRAECSSNLGVVFVDLKPVPRPTLRAVCAAPVEDVVKAEGLAKLRVYAETEDVDAEDVPLAAALAVLVKLRPGSGPGSRQARVAGVFSEIRQGPRLSERRGQVARRGCGQPSGGRPVARGGIGQDEDARDASTPRTHLVEVDDLPQLWSRRRIVFGLTLLQSSSRSAVSRRSLHSPGTFFVQLEEAADGLAPIFRHHARRLSVWVKDGVDRGGRRTDLPSDCRRCGERR